MPPIHCYGNFIILPYECQIVLNSILNERWDTVVGVSASYLEGLGFDS